MITTRRNFLKALGAVAAAAGTRLDVAPALAQSGPVKVGILTIKAGVGAPTGEFGLRGVQWATDRFNAQGGILGRKIELIVEEETNPKDSIERLRKLVLQDKVDCVQGVVSSGVILAMGLVLIGLSLRAIKGYDG